MSRVVRLACGRRLRSKQQSLRSREIQTFGSLGLGLKAQLRKTWTGRIELTIRIESLRLENIGGFTTTEFGMKNDSLLIGENNSGKTSLLRIVNWLLNILDGQLLNGGRELTRDEQQLLLPARATRNRARRVFLRVHIGDGRSARRFAADPRGIAEVRVQFRRGNIYARLGAPERGETPETEANAIALLDRLQKQYTCLYVPATRDGSSVLFTDLLRDALRRRLEEHMVYDGSGRPPTVPKRTREAATFVSTHANQAASRVWEEMRELIQGGFDPQGTILTQISAADLVELAIRKLEARFSTGDHDSETVAVESLGAGLQSVLTMAVAQLSMVSQSNRLLLLEEPEAFLHPSAQRTIAQQIFGKDGTQTIATTHSGAILAEVSPSNVVVLRSHSAYPAAGATDIQESKDRYLMSSAAAQTMFDRSFLLVEGPGDVAFLESLRRRLYAELPASVLNRMRVSAVGSKTAFGPWLRLLRRYANPGSGDLAFNVLVCADSIDAGPDVVRALRESGIVVPAALRAEILALNSGLDLKVSQPDSSVLSARTVAVNEAAMAADMPIHFSAIDLEYAILERLTDTRAVQIAQTHDIVASSCHDLMARMGSKGTAAAPSGKVGAKAPYIRAAIAEELGWGEITLNVKSLIWRWVLGATDEGQSLARPSFLT